MAGSHPNALLEMATELLHRVLQLQHQADGVVSDFFRQNRALGSRERHTLAETDDFIASVVDRWLAATQAASQVTRLPPPVAFQGAVGAMGLVERVELGHVLLGEKHRARIR